jgi:hypothetical protein
VRPWARVPTFLLIAVLAAVLLGACGGTETVTVVQTTTITETKAETVTMEAAPDADESAPDESTGVSPGATVRTVGGTGIDDGVVYRLHSVGEVSTLPVDEFSDPVRAVSGAKLIRADMTVKNNTKAPLDPFCGGGNSKLIDQNDRQYDVIEDILNVAGANFCDDIAPGFQTDVILVFQVPSDSKFAGLAVWNDDDENDYSGDSFVLFKR